MHPPDFAFCRFAVLEAGCRHVQTLSIGGIAAEDWNAYIVRFTHAINLEQA
jgi:hypothetical protein